MTGGLMQLVATGMQDIYLTGNPHISFFKILYRRHTEFSMVDYPIRMSNEQEFGSSHQIEIPQIADLVDHMIIMIDIEKPVLKKKEATVENLKNILRDYSIYLPDSYPYKDSDRITYNDIFVTNTILTDLLTKRVIDLGAKHMQTKNMIDTINTNYASIDDPNNFPYIAININSLNPYDNPHDPDGYMMTTEHGKNMYIGNSVDRTIYHNSSSIFVQNRYDTSSSLPLIIFSNQIQFNLIKSSDDLPKDGTKYGLLIGVNFYKDLLKEKIDRANNMANGKEKIDRLVNLQSQGILFCNNKYDDQMITLDQLIGSKYLIGYYIFESDDYSREYDMIKRNMLRVPLNVFDTINQPNIDYPQINRYELNKNAFFDNEGEYLLIRTTDQSAVSVDRMRNSILVNTQYILRNNQSIGFARCKILKDQMVLTIDNQVVNHYMITRSIRASTDFNLQYYKSIMNNDSKIQLEMSFLKAYYDDMINGWTYSTDHVNIDTFVYKLENTKLYNAGEIKNKLYDQMIRYIIYCNKKKYSHEYYKYFMIWMMKKKKVVFNPNFRSNTTSNNIIFNRKKFYTTLKYDNQIGNDLSYETCRLAGNPEEKYFVDILKDRVNSKVSIFEDDSIDDDSYLNDTSGNLNEDEYQICGNQCDIVNDVQSKYCDGTGTALNREIEFCHILHLIPKIQSITDNIKVVDFFDNHLNNYCNRTKRVFIFNRIYGYHIMKTYIMNNYNISVMNLVKSIPVIRDEIIQLIEHTIANTYDNLNNMLIKPLINLDYRSNDPVYRSDEYSIDYRSDIDSADRIIDRARYYCGIDQTYMLKTIYRLQFRNEQFVGDVVVEDEIKVDQSKMIPSIYNQCIRLSTDLKTQMVENSSVLNPSHWYQVRDIYKQGLVKMGISKVNQNVFQINYMPFIIAYYYSQNIDAIIRSYKNTDTTIVANNIVKKEISFVNDDNYVYNDRNDIQMLNNPILNYLSTNIGTTSTCPFHEVLDMNKFDKYDIFLIDNMIDPMDGECMVCWKTYCLNKLCILMSDSCQIGDSKDCSDDQIDQMTYIFRKEPCHVDEVSGIRFEKLIDFALYRIATIYRRYSSLLARIIDNPNRYSTFRSINIPKNSYLKKRILFDKYIGYLDKVIHQMNTTGVNIDAIYTDQLIKIIMFGTPNISNETNIMLLERMERKTNDTIWVGDIFDEVLDTSINDKFNIGQVGSYTYFRKNINILRKIQSQMIGRYNQHIDSVISTLKNDDSDIIKELYLFIEKKMDLKYIDGDYFNRSNDMNNDMNTFINPLVCVLNEFRELNIYYRMLLVRYKKRKFLLDIYHTEINDNHMYDFSEDIVQKYFLNIVLSIKNSQVYVSPSNNDNLFDYSKYYFNPNQTSADMTNDIRYMLSFNEMNKILYLLGLHGTINIQHVICLKSLVFIPEFSNHGQSYLYYPEQSSEYDIIQNKQLIAYNFKKISNESIYSRIIRSCRTISDFLYQTINTTPYGTYSTYNTVLSPYLILERIFMNRCDSKYMTPHISKWYDDHHQIASTRSSVSNIIQNSMSSDMFQSIQNSTIIGIEIGYILNMIGILDRYKKVNHNQLVGRQIVDEIHKEMKRKSDALNDLNYDQMIGNQLFDYLENNINQAISSLINSINDTRTGIELLDQVNRTQYTLYDQMNQMINITYIAPKKSIDYERFNKSSKSFHNFANVQNVLLFLMHQNNQLAMKISDDDMISADVINGKYFLDHTLKGLTQNMAEIKQILNGISAPDNYDPIKNKYNIINKNVYVGKSMIFTEKKTVFYNSEIYQSIVGLLKGSYPKHGWVKYLGYRLIESIELIMDSQEITSTNSDLMLLMDRMIVKDAHRRGVDQMIGNIPEIYTYDDQLKPRIRLYIDFFPWFNQSMQSNIPIIGTINSKISLRIRYRALSNVFCIEDSSLILMKPKMGTQLLCRYIYLEKAERKIFATTKMEQIMEKFLYSGPILKQISDLYDYDKTGSKNYLRHVFKLRDPTKYILIKLRLLAPAQTESDKINSIINWDKINTIDGKNIVKKMMIELGGMDRENFKDCSYYQTYHPLSRKIQPLENGEMIYSFAIHPMDLHPSGTSNMTELRSLTLIIELEEWFINSFNSSVKYTDLFTTSIEINLWACHYNVLAHMSGFCALRFIGTMKRT